MELDYGEIIALSFRWLKSTESWKYAFLVWALTLAAYLCVGLIFIALFPEIIAPALSSDPAAIEPLLENLLLNSNYASVFASKIILLVLVLFLLMFLSNNLAFLLTFGFAFRSFGAKHIEFNSSTFLSFLGLVVAEALFAMFYSLEEKYRKFHWGGLIVAILGVIMLLFAGLNVALALLGLALFLLGFSVWIIFTIYNSYRLFVSLPVFVSDKTSIIESLHKSWSLTKGKVFDLLLVSFVLGVIAFVLILLVYLILMLIFISLLSPVFGANSSIMAFNAADSTTQFFLPPVGLLLNSFFLTAIFLRLSGKKISK